MNSAVLELSIDKLFAQARASLDVATSNQQAAHEIFERKKGTCGTPEFVSLKGALDQSNAILEMRQREFDRAQAEFDAQAFKAEAESRRSGYNVADGFTIIGRRLC